MAVSGIDTTTATKTVNSGIGSLANNYETFLKLLTTQLKNQDPLSPLDTNDFTQQLTSMTGVQQQLLTNQLLTQVISQGQVGLSGSAVNLIGKSVTAEQPTMTLKDGKAQFGYSLGAGAAQTTLEVLDAHGQTIWSGKAVDNATGPHTLDWNGKSSSGHQMPDGGAYTLRVSSLDATGKAVASVTTTTGIVSRIENIDGQTILTIGAGKALITNITGVTTAPTTAPATPPTTPAAT
ncbi:MAG: flagellar hook capping protein [Caulobacteraceae bacterium]|nr:flagellar hook capping protein [Caulobacteraceae bacterium]